jgi:hypothetical protein
VGTWRNQSWLWHSASHFYFLTPCNTAPQWDSQNRFCCSIASRGAEWSNQELCQHDTSNANA